MTQSTTNAATNAMSPTGAGDLVIDAPSKRATRRMAWAGFALACLLVFTLFKLPEERIESYVQGSISAALSGQGISLSAGHSSVSMIFGPSYTMKDVSLTFPGAAPPVHIDEIVVKPSILPLLIGRIGAKVKLYDGNGKAVATFSMRGTNLDLSVHVKNLDLGRLGLAAMASGGLVNGVSARVTGDVDASGDTSAPQTLSGAAHLQIDKLHADPQTIYGFSIPTLSISEARIDATLEHGRLRVQTLRLGHPSTASDDIHATVTGDATLARSLDASTLNLRAQFKLSDNVMKSFSLLDAIMGAAKQSDGSFAYSITGPLSAPNAAPAGPIK